MLAYAAAKEQLAARKLEFGVYEAACTSAWGLKLLVHGALRYS